MKAIAGDASYRTAVEWRDGWDIGVCGEEPDGTCGRFDP